MSDRILPLLVVAFMLSVTAFAAPDTVDLAGQWGFRIDAGKIGIDQGWPTADFTDAIRLPGSMDEGGYGNPVTTVSLDHLNRLHEYVGVAWYRKDVVIPKEWHGKRITLFLERCHWESRLWVDGKEAGMRETLATPHEYDLSALLTPGAHRIALRIDNTRKYTIGDWSHSITEETQTNWNGVIGRLELRASDPVYLQDVKVYPDAAAKRARVAITVANTGRRVHSAVLSLALTRPGGAATPASPPCRIQAEKGLSTVDVDVALGADAALWDEFTPNVYTLTATLSAKKRCLDEKTVPFGLRDLSSKDGYVLVNGRRTLLRGNLECCIFPKTGYPPMDAKEWLRICRIAKSYGLNHFRFHSWCPPEAAFEAADQTGMMLQIEVDVWTELGTDPQLDGFVHAESKRILDAYGNHPSFCMLVVGNEPRGDHHKEFLAEIVAAWKKQDPRRLYSGASAWPVLAENDYHVLWNNNKTPIRLMGGPLQPGTDYDYRAALVGTTAPIVAHELGQWCVYPTYTEIPKYTGALRAKNLEAFRDSLAAHHMLDQAGAFARASGELQTLMYKADVEAVLRTPNLGGYQLLQLQDFPGQSTALVGFLDAFWDAKEGTRPEEVRQFCWETVPLLRTKKFAWTNAETFTAEMEIAHFGRAPLEGAEPVWSLAYSDGTVAASGSAPARTINQGSGTPLGAITIPLANVKAPAQLTLTVGIKGTPISNQWNLWVYPDATPVKTPANVLVAERLDDKALAVLNRGGRVVCVPRQQGVGLIKTAFEPTFWNAAMFKGQGRHLGILCDPKHPALKVFPTDEHTDWQWWDLLCGARAMVLDDLPTALRPTVQVIDNWNTNHRLGCLLEAKVGGGRLLVCTLNLGDGKATPAQRQMWNSLMAYAASDQFNPQTALDAAPLQKILHLPPYYTGVRAVSADSQAPGYPAASAIDDNPDTFWHTEFGDREPKQPHEIVLELPESKAIHGLRYLPRQDMNAGWVVGCEVYVSGDGKAWGGPVAKHTFATTSELQELRFAKPVNGRYVRFVTLSEVQGRAFASVAELNVF